MCGIVSIFAYNGNSGVDRGELRRIRDYMTARGPDGFGEWYSLDNRVGLGHRRLAIIDLSEAGAQPMQNADRSLVITFNGEIYNYQALRAGLEKKGYHFQSTSDTEVLLQLYADKGTEMLHDLRGMFAFAIWDERKKSLFLARDPFGIKPLYYSDDGGTFRIASQVKALLAGRKINTTPEPAGHVGFFLWGYVPEPYTLYKGIRALPAGSFMWVDQNGPGSTKNYCSIPRIFKDAENLPVDLSGKELHDRLHDMLLDTVKHHLIADVPVGVFLSAGMDSSTLVALASELNRSRLNTVTLGFSEFVNTRDDETSLATLVAAHYRTAHQTIWATSEDFKNELDPLLYAMDQPTADGVNTYFVSKAAVKAGLKVAISGLGGDELFGSYPSFQQIPRIVKTFAPLRDTLLPGKAFRLVTAPFLKYFTSPKYAGLLEYGGSYAGVYLLRRGLFMPWELPGLLDGDVVRDGWHELQTLIRLEDTYQGIGSSYLKVSALEMCWYMRNQLLRDADWASMAHSLEVRVPLVDIELAGTLTPLLAGDSRPNKMDMTHTPMKRLPDEVTSREKTGFSVPVREWLLSDDDSFRERGLRGWSKKVYKEFCKRKIGM
jgi:asparagine synthase (glutamine-hydrolysing)